MEAPDLDVLQALASIGEGTSGADLFLGPPRPADDTTPSAAVFVLSTGGAPPEAYCGGGLVDEVTSTVQVRVRSDSNDFAGGLAKARGILAALHKRALTGYVWVSVREPDPIYLGPDEQGRHGWSMNLELEHER